MTYDRFAGLRTSITQFVLTGECILVRLTPGPARRASVPWSGFCSTNTTCRAIYRRPRRHQHQILTVSPRECEAKLHSL